MDLAFIFLLMVSVLQTIFANEPIIQTNIRGSIIKTSIGKVVWEFLGIPYAEPPVGLLRFRRPQPVKNWNGTWNATQYSDTCMQVRTPFIPQEAKLSEDCLYLNVWVPKSIDNNSSHLLPVMVWIHGGGFMVGTSSDPITNGTILAQTENVIVVSINYRLSIFGFIYAGVDEAPGNVGLLDQLEAIKWTKQNIHAFGGNPESITIFGESAGGSSAGFHVLSPISRPYFNRAIMQSGVMTILWQEKSAIKSSLVKIAKHFHCLNNATDNQHQINKEEKRRIVQCLQNKSAHDLVLFSEKSGAGKLASTWFPVVDDYFLLQNPLSAMKEGSFNPVDILLGTAKYEMAIIMYMFFPSIFNISGEIELPLETFKSLFQLFLAFPRQQNNPTILASTFFEYAALAIHNNDTNSSKLAEILEQMSTDGYFECPTELVAQQLTVFGRNVYRYVFTYENPAVPAQHSLMKCTHTNDIAFAFGQPTLQAPKNNFAAALSQGIMRFWANFAKTGNPNLNTDGSKTQIEWPKYSQNRAYIELDGKFFTKHTGGYRMKECLFWNELVPNLDNLTSSCVQ